MIRGGIVGGLYQNRGGDYNGDILVGTIGNLSVGDASTVSIPLTGETTDKQNADRKPFTIADNVITITRDCTLIFDLEIDARMQGSANQSRRSIVAEAGKGTETVTYEKFGSSVYVRGHSQATADGHIGSIYEDVLAKGTVLRFRLLGLGNGVGTCEFSNAKIKVIEQ